MSPFFTVYDVEIASCIVARWLKAVPDVPFHYVRNKQPLTRRDVI